MNPDVFITIAFTGIAVMVALVGLFLVVPQQRREDAARAHESKRPAKREDGAAGRPR